MGLRRFWVDCTPAGLPPVWGFTSLNPVFDSRLPFQLGITAWDEADCLAIARRAVGDDSLLPRHIEADVDVSALPIPLYRFGVTVWRGIWFPAHNLRMQPLSPGSAPY